MAYNVFRCFWGLSLLSLSLYLSHSISTSNVYIVYLGHVHNHDPFLTSEYHLHLLTSIFQSKEEAKKAMIYSYKHVFSGFAATINASQARILANTRGVISVFESQMLQLHTTRSWDFMGLTLNYSEGTPLQLAHGDDIIVGVLDSGVWPESASLKEEPSMGPMPKHWKGKCIAGEEFDPKKACNRKLIGARYYLTGFERRYGKINKTKNPEYISSRDYLGHGTHTASTAVGSRDMNASIFGFAQGTARGGAPRARLAVYKVCWNRNGGTCTEEDVLAAFDEALHDGVHVISASFGKVPPLRAFFASSSDIGSFHAMQLSVSVIFSAGNAGPDPSLVGNVNPWSICVAASSLDRSFPTKILSDDGNFFMGEGLVTKNISGTLAKARSYFSGGICNTRNWMNISLSGKILLCFSTDGPVISEDAEFVARRANAAALIFVQPLTRPAAAVSVIPLVRIDTIQGTKLNLLPNCTKVRIFPSETAFKRSPAPMVSDFSSRGPSSISPDFLKPDISAPGINILAAWPPNVPPSVFPGDDRSVDWNFDSGTSMSCPHVSGVVALLNSAHPSWSPAAIRSALMTTAYNKDINGYGILVEASTKSSDPFDIGAGHINPVNAFDPGLIYDMTTRDYVRFLCNNGYSQEQIEAMVICPQTTCTRCPNKLEPDYNINYPSITVSNLNCTSTVKRTVRNVGHKKTAVYFGSTMNPNGVEVFVWPKILIFSPFKEEMTYFVTLKPLKVSRGRYEFGSITWSDGFHQVRSPLVVQVNINEDEIEAAGSTRYEA
ncbi:Tripeptidyl-peptidase II [Handroanthus impetiginosus]|uniref:Tripeptidyl-peptidase II n=1 Tax=Handroanthus impetiginosus TaxID=429701 RepID=A0A2G9GKM2_9LAMI|nr:Tripeptidyl-peptidase II [Handroanthus impetiginosus]